MKINLVDLAGSERLSRLSKDQDGNHIKLASELIEESISTNKS